ncbi:FAD-dependent monooxygenase [Nonomuraea spiralis]|uniref:FAD-dependent monooxygenase n=1 Tax=Nonomuraea TaxID=83681 RepID=UPI000F79A93B|nr:FAD-dependent monooxygenase [Nonomuraea sp. WAC 01424]RSN11429.1 monooxygenase [Nonomuraea sp. WAC 01424]
MGHAVVIGAGIGGLAAAVALQQRGWEVTSLERAPSIEPVGSGLSVFANALKALSVLGVDDQVRALSAIRGVGGVRRATSGRWLVHMNEEAAAQHGDPVVLLRRADLVEALAARLKPGTIRLNTTVTGADPDTGRVTFRTGQEGQDNGPGGTGEVTGDLVVAADGIHSPIRTALFPGHPEPRYAGITAWRMLVPGHGVPGQTFETWGSGKVFGYMALADGLAYCYGTDAVPAGGGGGDQREELLRLFGGWHDPIPALVAATPPANIIRNDVYYLPTPLPAMHRGRIAVLGDAAHAMTPNMGQGACQAIEDAVVLAHVAGQEHGLAAYTAARLARTAKVVARSAAICRVIRWRNPLAVRLRDLGVATTWRFAPHLLTGPLDDLLTWTPPTDDDSYGGGLQTVINH